MCVCSFWFFLLALLVETVELLRVRDHHTRALTIQTKKTKMDVVFFVLGGITYAVVQGLPIAPAVTSLVVAGLVAAMCCIAALALLSIIFLVVHAVQGVVKTYKL